MKNDNHPCLTAHSKHEKPVFRNRAFFVVEKLNGKIVIKNRPRFLERNAMFLGVRNGLSWIPLDFYNIYIICTLGSVSSQADKAPITNWPLAGVPSCFPHDEGQQYSHRF